MAVDAARRDSGRGGIARTGQKQRESGRMGIADSGVGERAEAELVSERWQAESARSEWREEAALAPRPAPDRCPPRGNRVPRSQLSILPLPALDTLASHGA